MKPARQKQALACAVAAARAAGKLMRDNLREPKEIHSSTQHDIKLELDVRCQTLIGQMLQRSFPQVALLGEEGVQGDAEAPERWVVDPIDGTVNFTYGIPHACVSIALQEKSAPGPPRSATRAKRQVTPITEYTTLAGVVYDPFTDELWTARRGQPARLNGRIIHVSPRRKLAEAIVCIGFAKQRSTLEKMLPAFQSLIHRVRKIRIMGSAALELVYVASGRADAYLEYGLRLWDIAAGGLILECAGGDFWHQPVAGIHTYHLIANNGLLRSQLRRWV